MHYPVTGTMRLSFIDSDCYILVILTVIDLLKTKGNLPQPEISNTDYDYPDYPFVCDVSCIIVTSCVVLFLTS